MDDEIIVLATSKKKAVLLLLGALAFVACGIFSVRTGENALIGWVCILFFGLGIPVSIYMLTPGAGELRIDRQGIQMKGPFKPMKLAWSEVNGFYVDYVRTGYSRTKMIAIEFSDSYNKLRAGRQVAQAMTGMQGALPNNFSRPAEEVCELLNSAKKKWG
ncbi:STM3941 family protein [Dyella mobilis]|uniref:PH domain-containing protein n=1 Tax=Dyella mobilis TaxID=1849582 RepID=A0ABS2KJ97_9GAMM|nr:STM3941 family protein [Dyella mobilis]MBM7131252.1 hypothetical protein [Dyella mobilis]GLQ98811.1 hypothetical protein GCM10007863_32310 [Dyella mobilis]